MASQQKTASRPAAFPKTSKPEQVSADILHGLLDRSRVMGMVQVMDKVPNSDGFLTLLDHAQVPLGYIDVQLKTLSDSYRKNPSFQCQLPLISYAMEMLHPVLLVVVDQMEKKAYWLHLDNSIASAIPPGAKARSIVLRLKSDQVIDGADLSYISAWEDILSGLKDKVQHYDDIIQQRDLYKKLISGPSPRLLPAYSINEFAIREIHYFLDLLNQNMEREFASIKDTLYHNCWKFAIGLSKYEADEIVFLILPIPISSNSPLILEVDKKARPSADDLFNKDKATILMMRNDKNPLRSEPEKLAMELIEKDVFRVINDKSLPLPHRAMAEEYVLAFARSFHRLLGLGQDTQEIDIRHVAKTIFVLLPILEELEHGRSTGEITCNIDHYKAYGHEYTDRLFLAEQAREKGFSANPKLKLHSHAFEMELLRHYLDFLVSLGRRKASSRILPNINRNSSAPLVWANWDLSNIFANLSLVIGNFLQVYDQTVRAHFPLLSKELDFFQEDSVVLLVFAPNVQGGASALLYFRFRAKKGRPLKKLLFFHAQDPLCPDLTSGDRYLTIWNDSFTFFGRDHELRASGDFSLKFIFSATPCHSLVRHTLALRLKDYFSSRGVSRSSYRPIYGHGF